MLDKSFIYILLNIFIHIFERNPILKNGYPVENFWSMEKTKKVMYLPLIIQVQKSENKSPRKNTKKTYAENLRKKSIRATFGQEKSGRDQGDLEKDKKIMIVFILKFLRFDYCLT